MSDQTVIALIGLFGAITAGFFKLIKDQQKIHDRLAKGVDKLAKSSEKNVKATEKVANATIRSANEAKERNGHLAELTIQQADKIIGNIKSVRKQHIDKLTVDNEVVQNQIVKKVKK